MGYDKDKFRMTYWGKLVPVIRTRLTPKQQRAREKAKSAKQARKKQRNVLQQIVVNHYKHIYK